MRRQICGLLSVLILVTSVVFSQHRTAMAEQSPSLKKDAEAGETMITLSPEHWPEGDLEKYNQLNTKFGGQNQLATSDRAVIAGTTSASAIRAGLEALNQGGSAVDAVLTTSLTQISLAQGAWVSYAGIISMVYYDADSDRVYCMNGGYNTVLGEDSPLTIPKQESGRTALVPGYMAGVGSAHQRFGKLPFKEIFAPAIYYAENGFALNSLNDSMMQMRVPVLSRLPDTKSLFINEETGEFYKKGEVFRQPELAKTLRKVSEQGADYMYNGDWARRLVAAVQAEGGKMTQEDLEKYRVLWTNPLKVKYSEYDVFVPGLPAQGGVHIAESLNLLSVSNLKEKGHYTKSPESFFWLSNFNTIFALSFVPRESQVTLLGMEAPMEYRCQPQFAKKLWTKMNEESLPFAPKPKDLNDNHSDAVVAIDRLGNVAAIVHTSNTAAWGKTGIFVDGVSIPDSAAEQQFLTSQTEPGTRLPDPTEPLIVMQDGKPFVALSSIGGGLHAKTITSLVNLLDFKMDIESSIGAPSMHLPDFSTIGQVAQQVFAGDFPDGLIEEVRELGMQVKVLATEQKSGAPRGYVVGKSLDHKTGKRKAVSTKMFNAAAMGQK